MAPVIALNLTLTVPSLTLAPSQMASGKRPAVRSAETCASTFGLLGAESSARTSHLGGPPAWVMVTVHPGGTVPTAALSKPVTSAEHAMTPHNATTPTSFIATLVC